MLGKLIGLVAGGALPYVLGALLTVIAGQYVVGEYRLHEAKRTAFSEGAKAQLKADAEEIGKAKALGDVARSESAACFKTLDEVQKAQRDVEQTKGKVQSLVAASRADMEKQRIEAARAKAERDKLIADRDRWQQMALATPVPNQTRDQSCSEAEAIITDRLNKRRTP